jgi:hypothetical protein
MSDPVHDPLRASGPGSEEEAWARVVAAWADEAEQRRYLDRFDDLEGLRVAGKRYRDVLAERPDDQVAARMRDEVLKRATVHGLAALPRTARSETPLWARRIIMLLALMSGLAAVAFVTGVVFRLLGARS